MSENKTNGTRENVLHRLLKPVSKETEEELKFVWNVTAQILCSRCESAISRKDCNVCLTRKLFIKRKIKAVK
jgi:hypothetical protein